MHRNIALRGAELVLDEAIKELRLSVHPCGCEEGKEGDDAQGKILSTRIVDHKNKINDAVKYHYEALDYYISVKKGSKT